MLFWAGCCVSHHAALACAASPTITRTLSLSLSLSLTLHPHPHPHPMLTRCAALGFLGPARTLGASTDSNPNPIL